MLNTDWFLLCFNKMKSKKSLCYFVLALAVLSTVVKSASIMNTDFDLGGRRDSASPMNRENEQDNNNGGNFPGVLPPRPGWKWWRYHDVSDKDILDHLVSTQHYDRRERPPSESGGAVQVNVSAIITDIKWRTDDYSELVLDMLMSYHWFDPRLIHDGPSSVVPRRRGKSTGYLNAFHHLGQIWLPERTAPDFAVGKEQSVALRVFSNGTVSWMTSQQVTLRCTGNRLEFPFDEITCHAKVTSMSHTNDEIKHSWSSIFKEDRPLDKVSFLTSEAAEAAIELAPTVKTLSYGGGRVLGFWSSDCSNAWKWRGNYSCLGVTARLKREIGKYWSDLFLPDMVLVSTSFLTFWLDWSSVPARSILGAGSMLCYFANRRWSDLEAEADSLGGGSASSSSMSPLDVWRAVTLVFLYAATFEFVLVNYLGRKSKTIGSKKEGKLRELLEQTQQQLERLKYISSATVVPAQAAKMTEHRTATLMRHRRDCSRHNLAVLLDPNNPNNSQGQSLGSLSMDGGCNPVNLEPPVPMGLLASSTSNEDAIFTPHYETIKLRGARAKCVFNVAQQLDKICRAIFPFLYLAFVIAFFCKYQRPLN